MEKGEVFQSSTFCSDSPSLSLSLSLHFVSLLRTTAQNKVAAEQKMASGYRENETDIQTDIQALSLSEGII